MDNDVIMVKAEIQCPICGEMYFRPVRQSSRSVKCRVCHQFLYLGHATQAHGEVDDNGSTYLADNIWGSKKDFEEMFIAKNDFITDARQYGFIR